MDTAIIQRRLPVLLKYLNSDTERQLQALYALQALIVSLEQPASECRTQPTPAERLTAVTAFLYPNRFPVPSVPLENTASGF